MKKYLAPGALSLLTFLLALTYFTCIKRTKGFCYQKIHSRYTYEPRWDFGKPSPEQEELLNQISSQTFSLLGSGKECYAFVSEDGKIVVKFFKQKHMRTQYLLNYLPLSQEIQMIRNETLIRHSARRERLYQSYQIARERLQDRSGVLYLHLTKTNFIKRPIYLTTPQGKKLILKLDDMEFLVQKRAEPIFGRLKAQPEKGKETIDAILDYLVERNALGIGDNDMNCERNLGLIKERAVQIDIGELYPSLPSPPSKTELTTATLDLKAFLEVNQEELVTYLEQEIERRCASNLEV